MAKEQPLATTSISDKIALFVQKYRVFLLGFLIVLVAALIGTAVFLAIRDTLQKNAIVTLEGLEKRKIDLGDLGDSSKSLEVQALLEEFNNFAKSTFGYSSAKAHWLAADIYAARNEWAAAEAAWAASAEAGVKTYLVPLSLFNAAAAAEEQGKLDEAIDYYNRSLLFEEEFPAASRVRFNIGRIYEAKKDKTAAAEAYRSLIEKAHEGSTWAKLAQSRIIAMELE
ncbi:hypothetical protein AGMMS50230_23060 [Spirochaetia bacterium]|nr:hypothetical protein AGMMS50230_23060 [Spirochaetia bacterium]